MKKIQSLVRDIYDFVQNPPEKLDAELVKEFGSRLAELVGRRLSMAERKPPTLRVSNLGEKCLRKLWYSVNHPELAEPLPAPTRIKFLFGDILEQLLLFLAKLSGHTVENEQAEVDIDGVLGHIDGTIDSELVDCKSASTASFSKFSDHTLGEDDTFGYLTQLGAYGSRIGSGSNHFLAIDKQHGHIALDTHAKGDSGRYRQLVEDKRNVLASSVRPDRGYSDEPHQKSGNRKLGVVCSYCAFKFHCWPGLRVAYYSGKPVFLTRIVRFPKVEVI